MTPEQAVQIIQLLKDIIGLTGVIAGLVIAHTFWSFLKGVSNSK